MVLYSIINTLKSIFEERKLQVIWYQIPKEHLVSTAEAWRNLSLSQCLLRFFIYKCPQTSELFRFELKRKFHRLPSGFDFQIQIIHINRLVFDCGAKRNMAARTPVFFVWWWWRNSALFPLSHIYPQRAQPVGCSKTFWRGGMSTKQDGYIWAITCSCSLIIVLSRRKTQTDNLLVLSITY